MFLFTLRRNQPQRRGCSPWGVNPPYVLHEGLAGMPALMALWKVMLGFSRERKQLCKCLRLQHFSVDVGFPLVFSAQTKQELVTLQKTLQKLIHGCFLKKSKVMVNPGCIYHAGLCWCMCSSCSRNQQAAGAGQAQLVCKGLFYAVLL